MTETKFTKGEWRAIRNSSFWEVEAFNDNGSWISGVGDVCTSNPYDADSGEQEANAHLFAASKEMYEALEATLKKYVDLANSGDAGFWDPEQEEHVISARAILAKARGEA